MEGQLDDFIEYLMVIEENNEQFSKDQIKKLELIRTKVSELVKRAQPPSQQAISQPGALQSQAQSASLKIVESFESFTELNETVKKRGNSWVVTDKSGKKTLGKHSSKNKAVKQLQAIEISKHKNG